MPLEPPVTMATRFVRGGVMGAGNSVEFRQLARRFRGKVGVVFSQLIRLDINHEQAFNHAHPALVFDSRHFGFGIGAVHLVRTLLWCLPEGYGNYRVRGHQDFAKNGLGQIEPASQMSRLFTDCRHYVVYEGRDAVSTWNTDAYFGGRYKLTMQVPVKIESSTQGRTIGEPRFFLVEVSSVAISPSGQVTASYSDSRQFGLAEWNRVFAAGGDFGQIGYQTNTGPPIKGFDAYSKSSR